jgi:hypothetical protein
MSLKDRLFQAKCKVGMHSGEWEQLAAGSCDERRTCVHCGDVANRTEHHMSDWAYSADPAAPACTRERHCGRCPHAQLEVRHTMEWQRDYEGRHERCRVRLDCSRCGFTEGRTKMAHRWDMGTASPGSGLGNSMPTKTYTCWTCSRQVTRTGGPPSPSEIG